ncbi:MAG: FtsX-like permease family protein, partial [Gemmatimonadales bacterium]
AVAMVALIAAVNVANLLLARGASQEREFAVRTALGARPRDLIGFAFVESLLLALAGGAAGLLVAWGGTRVLDVLRPPELEYLGSASVDVAVLGFTLALSVVSGLLFGLAPAIQAARATNVHGTLKTGGRGQTIGRKGWRVRGGLVAAELALAIILLTGAGLLLRSFQNLQRVDMGFDAQDVLTYQLSLPDARYPKAANVELFYQSLLARMRSIPGVRSAAAISGLPLDGYGYSISTHSLDGTEIEASAQPSTQVRFVTPGVFATLGISVIEGRDITEADRDGAPNVVVMSAGAAKLLFGDKDPLGHSLTISTTFGDGRGRLGGEVVGVVKDVHDVSPGTPSRPTIYLSHAQFPAGDMAVVARTPAGNDPLALAQAARAQVRELDRDLPMTGVRTMSAVERGSIAQSRFAMLLLGCFAVVALSLAAVGVFGVMSFMVAQRTREIGVRIALGASAGKVVAETMRRCVPPVAAGVLVGVGGALMIVRTMTSLLFDVRPQDPALLTVVAAGLALVAFASAWLPARRASHVDPVLTLRDE